MTTANRKIYGWEIEGFGDYGVIDEGYNGDLRLSYAYAEAVAGGRLYVNGLADLPNKIPTTARVLEGHTTQSTMQILIDRVDVPDGRIQRYGRLAARFFWQARPVPWAVLQAGITASSGSFVVDVISGEDVPADGSIIYIGREAMALDVVSGSGATRTLSVQRGVLGTDAEAHELDDAEVFSSNPLRQDRRVTLYEYDADTDTEAVVWRGVVESVDVTDDVQVIAVTCRDLLGTFSKRKVGDEQWRGWVKVQMGSVQYADGSRSASGLMVVQSDRATPLVPRNAPFFATVSAGFLPGTARYGSLGIDVKATCIAVEGIAVAVAVDQRDAVVAPGFVRAYRHGAIGFNAIEISGRLIDGDQNGKTLNAREVLVCDPESPLCLFKDDNGTVSGHPAVIMLCLLTSTGTATWAYGGSHTVGTNGDYDWLPAPWGLGIPEAWVDRTAFERLSKIDALTTGLRARAGYIGADDRAALDILGDMAQAMGCYIYLTPGAQISIRRLSDPGTGNVDWTLTEEDVAWAQNEGDGQGMTGEKPVYSVALECAAQGPGGKAGMIIDARKIGQRALSRYRFHAVEDKIESTLIYGDPEQHTLRGEEVGRIAALFRWRYAYCLDRLPQYRLRLVQGAPIVAAGQWVTLSHTYFLDNADFTRGFTAHRCLILEHTWDLREGTQEVVVVDVTPVTGASSLLSPSWRIATVTSATVFTLDADYFDPEGDLRWFDVGAAYEYQLWTEDGVLRSTVASRYALTLVGSTVTLSAAWSDGGGAVTPAVGNIVRLVEYPTAPLDWVNVWTWLGDVDMRVDGGAIANVRWDV